MLTSPRWFLFLLLASLSVTTATSSSSVTENKLCILQKKQNMDDVNVMRSHCHRPGPPAGPGPPEDWWGLMGTEPSSGRGLRLDPGLLRTDGDWWGLMGTEPSSGWGLRLDPGPLRTDGDWWGLMGTDGDWTVLQPDGPNTICSFQLDLTNAEIIGAL